jgi:hypothetical protein
MILEAPRLILRPFREEDVDLLAELMANEDFMRFSLGVYSRKQTAAFLEKFSRSRTAVCLRNLPCLAAASSIKKSIDRMKFKSVIDCIRIIGTRAWQPKQRKRSAIMPFAI